VKTKMRDNMQAHRENMKAIKEDSRKNPPVSVGDIILTAAGLGWFLHAMIYQIIDVAVGTSNAWGLIILFAVFAALWVLILRFNYTSYKIRVLTRDIYTELKWRIGYRR
jgi:hypothetical protein